MDLTAVSRRITHCTAVSLLIFSAKQNNILRDKKLKTTYLYFVLYTSGYMSYYRILGVR